jgi:uncharacterized hydrophobic protein (TIGR00271 family)
LPGGLRNRLTGESRTPDEIREAVYLFTGDVAAKQSRFWLLLVLSTVIATAGVIADSTATVIGAMIIAPLAIPIQGAAVGIAFGELRPLLLSLAVVAGATALVVALAALIAVVLPELHPSSHNSQITGRASPTLVDLLAAGATGLAGAFALGRRDIGDILPGVAIAISLVPPLAVVGVTATAGEWGSAWGALLLFLTNVLAIIVAGTAVFSTLNAQYGRTQDGAFRTRPVYSVVAIASALVVAALAAATYRTVQLQNWRDAATQVGSDWAAANGERLVGVRFDGDELVLIVEGSSDGADDGELTRLLAGAVPSGTPIAVNRIAGRRAPVGHVAD